MSDLLDWQLSREKAVQTLQDLRDELDGVSDILRNMKQPAEPPHPWQAGFQGVRAVEVEMAIGAAMVAHVTGIHQRDEQAMREFVIETVREAVAEHVRTAHLPAAWTTTAVQP